jgi:hypothetical protein
MNMIFKLAGKDARPGVYFENFVEMNKSTRLKVCRYIAG